MNFETSTDAVSITSDEGDALVPGTQARAAAELEASATGKPVTIRNPVTDEVLATIRPADLFDHLVGAREKPCRNGHAESLCRLEIDRQP